MQFLDLQAHAVSSQIANYSFFAATAREFYETWGAILDYFQGPRLNIVADCPCTENSDCKVTK